MDEDSPAFARAFTDTAGIRHFTTIPRGKVAPSVWSARHSAATSLSAPFAELHAKTTAPFVSAIRDSAPALGTAFKGKLVLVGDAFCLFRPHTGSSTNQAARQARELAEVIKGERTLESWEESAVKYARTTAAVSKAFGEYCFTGKVPEILAAALRPETEG
jgi:2-polyprenyl-6-methoxyphenol hydroxylase-like FAD-dependent oxidoreductase